ncbi:MAG: bifunctional folylpolyglutamate synthase/dihydrofolate synthase, partial [Clostridia bacterium]|nr:bifunctional folylpolyglutamate synthase/dihydrofolate synthase [Clostridia bacterium]
MQYDLVKKRFLIYIVSMGKMTYQEAREYIEEVKQYGSVLGLETMSILMKYLDNPQDHLKFVHIAGTNGKGSVLAGLTSVLTHAGYRVGSYSSPVVCEPRESIRVLETPINEEDYARLTERLKEAATKTKEQTGAHPTVFEIETAMAFLYFGEQHCDPVILETGLGGSLDATNIVKTTEAAIITSISLDHTEYLGNTLSQIAMKKAGIIKSGADVIMLSRACQDETEATELDAAIEVVSQTASSCMARFHTAQASDIRECSFSLTETRFSYHEYTDIGLTMLGSYQPENAILVIETAKLLRNHGYVISDEHILNGLYHAKWPGRFSIICDQPLFIVDGAHNAN